MEDSHGYVYEKDAIYEYIGEGACVECPVAGVSTRDAVPLVPVFLLEMLYHLCRSFHLGCCTTGASPLEMLYHWCPSSHLGYCTALAQAPRMMCPGETCSLQARWSWQRVWHGWPSSRQSWHRVVTMARFKRLPMMFVTKRQVLLPHFF